VVSALAGSRVWARLGRVVVAFWLGAVRSVLFVSLVLPGCSLSTEMLSFTLLAPSGSA